MDNTLYSWVLFLSVFVFIGAIVVNLVIEKKKGTGMITSILAIVGAVFALYYLIAWFVGDNAKDIREAEDNDFFELKGSFKFGRILVWFYVLCALAGGAFPAAFGGFAKGDKI